MPEDATASLRDDILAFLDGPSPPAATEAVFRLLRRAVDELADPPSVRSVDVPTRATPVDHIVSSLRGAGWTIAANCERVEDGRVAILWRWWKKGMGVVDGTGSTDGEALESAAGRILELERAAMSATAPHDPVAGVASSAKPRRGRHP